MTERETRDKLTIIDFSTSTPSCFILFILFYFVHPMHEIRWKIYRIFFFSLNSHSQSIYLNFQMLFFRSFIKTLNIHLKYLQEFTIRMLENPCCEDSKFINLYLPFLLAWLDFQCLQHIFNFLGHFFSWKLLDFWVSLGQIECWLLVLWL